MHIDTIDEVPERYRVLIKYYYFEKKPNENTVIINNPKTLIRNTLITQR